MSTSVLIGVVVGGVVVILLTVVLTLLLRDPSKGQPRPMCQGCGRVMKPDWTRCLFCGWMPAGVVPRLEFLCGPLAGSVYDLGDEVTTIGSVAGNTIVLADPAVSRKHLGIRKNGDIFEFADLGSTNGVYINGQRMPRKQLSSGDILRVGNTEIVFRWAA